MSNGFTKTNYIWTAIVGVIITIFSGLLFMNLSISQESDARNIQKIPRIENRLENLEDDIDGFRRYFLDKVDIISENTAHMEGIDSKLNLIIDRFNIIEARFYDSVSE